MKIGARAPKHLNERDFLSILRLVWNGIRHFSRAGVPQDQSPGLREIWLRAIWRGQPSVRPEWKSASSTLDGPHRRGLPAASYGEVWSHPARLKLFAAPPNLAVAGLACTLPGRSEEVDGGIDPVPFSVERIGI
jgi:hypothetical protein